MEAYTRGAISEQIEEYIDNVFREFQEEHGIESGDLPFDLESKICGHLYDLSCAVLEAMEWQKENAPHIIYEQTYAPDTDTTFIMKTTHLPCADYTMKREIVGFYSGEPNVEDFETYKTAGTVAEY